MSTIYTHYKKLTGALALESLRYGTFETSDFHRAFIQAENHLQVSVRTPLRRSTNGHRMGGWRFVDFSDRIYRYLFAQVRKGVLSVSKEGGRYRWIVEDLEPIGQYVSLAESIKKENLYGN